MIEWTTDWIDAMTVRTIVLIGVMIDKIGVMTDRTTVVTGVMIDRKIVTTVRRIGGSKKKAP